jgi:lysine 2,3-aminomutase
MENWQKSLSRSVTSLEGLAEHFSVDTEPLKAVVQHYPMRVSLPYLSLVREIGDPIWLQFAPDPRELRDENLSPDPLNEKGLSPVPDLIHRYPDRVVLIVSSSCATFCRFCLRKRYVGCAQAGLRHASLSPALDYIEKSGAVRDVILSGGDPLLLPDDELDSILTRIRGIGHVEIVRIGSRTPVTLPERITLRLCRMLKKHHPVYVNTHFNHPREITAESTEACSRLADAGIPMGNQTVLLKGVNDDLSVMRDLMQKLLRIRVRPYYIHQMDLVKGTGHFRTRIEQGIRIMEGLRGHISGMATPYYVIDLPGGKGKVPVVPEYVKREGETYLLRNYLGEVIRYQDPESSSL